MHIRIPRQSTARRAPSSTTFRAAAGGFTLLELLVVIAVIALLAVILVPGFRRAVGAAQAAACRNNLRLWGIAFMAYASDHQGYLPHCDDSSRSDKSGLAISPHNFCYVDVLPPDYMGSKAWRDYPEDAPPTDGFWQCPSVKRRPGKRYHSYAMNSYLEHDFDYGLDGRAAQSSYLYLPRCTAPAQTILMFEQAAESGDGVFGNKYPNPNAGRHTAEDATALSVRHRRFLGGEGCNVLFLDGHVKWRDDVWARTRSDVPAHDDLEWYPYIF